jgi:hypothetical protein
MTDVGELVVTIRANSSQLQQEMSSATQSVKQSSDQMSSALGTVKGLLGSLGVAFSIGSLVEFTRSALEGANNIYIMGQRIGFATDTLSKLNIPLLQNGSSIDEFSNAMKFMNRNVELAAEGNPKLIETFNNLGLSVTKLKALTPEQQFYAIANAMSGVTDQGKFTADGMAIMGRGFASIAPLIKAAGGNMADFVSSMDGLTKEEIAKVHEYDDAWVSFWEHMKMGAVEAVVAMHDFAAAAKEANNADNFNLFGTGPKEGSRGSTSTSNPGSVIYGTGDKVGPFMSSSKDTSAKGDNTDIDGSAQKAASSAKAMQDYIQNLRDETAALSMGKEQLAEYRAEKAAASAAGIELSQVTPENKAAIDAEADAYFQATEKIKLMNAEQQKQIQVTAQLEAQISSSMADIILNFKSVGQTITNVLDQIAKKILEDQVTTPLVNSLGQMLGAPDTAGKTAQATGGAGLFGGVFQMLGFASGGVPPVGVPSIVGENGPELFVPGQTGTIIPNSKLGGSSVIVQQTINMSPGLAETVGVAIRNAAPAIAAMAHASTINALQKGGSESRIVGKRS